MNIGFKTIKKLMFVIIVTVPALLTAQDYTLKQAQDYAVDHYYEAVNSGLDIKKSKSKIWEITAMGLPHIDAAASYRYAADLEFDFPPGTVDGFMAAFAADNISQGKLSASQIIFDGSYIVGLQAAKKFFQFSKFEKEKTDNDVRSMIASSYYLVLVADENIKVLAGSFANIESSIKEMTALVEQGFTDETELDQLQLMKSDLESSIQSANQSQSVAKQMLKLNMGLEVSKTIGLSDSLVGIVDLISIEALAGQQFDAANNPNLKALSSQRDLLGLDVKRYKAQRLPRVAAFYQYQNTAYQFEWDWFQDASWYDAQNVGVNISIPILSSGQQGAVINQAKLELTKMENVLTYAQSAMGIQFLNAINGLNSKHANYQNSEKSLKIAQKIYNRTEIKHQEGMASSFELSQMKTQVLQSQGKYIQSLFNLLNAKAELDKLQNK